jgi:hypothetical protein
MAFSRSYGFFAVICGSRGGVSEQVIFGFEKGIEFSNAGGVSALSQSFGGFDADELIFIRQRPFQQSHGIIFRVLRDIRGGGGASGGAFSFQIHRVFHGGENHTDGSEH